MPRKWRSRRPEWTRIGLHSGPLDNPVPTKRVSFVRHQVQMDPIGVLHIAMQNRASIPSDGGRCTAPLRRETWPHRATAAAGIRPVRRSPGTRGGDGNAHGHIASAGIFLDRDGRQTFPLEAADNQAAALLGPRIREDQFHFAPLIPVGAAHDLARQGFFEPGDPVELMARIWLAR